MNQKQNSDPENSNVLKPEDYVEPNCVLCGDPYGVTPEVKPVPQQRIIQKMDEYMSRKDYEGAERHLLYWLEEAKLGKDLRGQLSIRNELIGFYRKRGRKASLAGCLQEACLSSHFAPSLRAALCSVGGSGLCKMSRYSLPQPRPGPRAPIHPGSGSPSPQQEWAPDPLRPRQGP